LASYLVKAQKIKKRLMREWRKIHSWRKLAEQYPPVKFGTLQRFATDPEYIPVDDEILIALGVKIIRKPKPPVPVSPRWWRELRKNAVRSMAKQTRQDVLRK
jgi:hypothetical protein